MLTRTRLLRKRVVLDGNTAAVHVAYGLSEQAFIYPISPSTPMCELAAQWAAEGRKNVFGQPVKVTQMQSEGGAAGALHGVLDSGGLASTFTCSQGLLLMIPNMYIIAGQLSPCVFHVTARALSKQGLSIYAEHTDVMAVRQTGWGMLASSSVQEAMDMAAVAHLSSLHTSIPMVHFFDGYRTSHEISKIEMIDYASLAGLVPRDKLQAFRQRGLTPTAPHARACNTGSDAFFQGSEAVNRFYDEAPGYVLSVLKQVSKVTGRSYSLFDYFGPESPEHVIVTIGSSTQTVCEVIASRMSEGKHGSLNVRLLRPWSADDFIKALPSTVKRVTVLDRTKDAAAIGEPLFLDVAATLQLAGKRIQLLGGRYGLGSREFGPPEVTAVLDNADREYPQAKFTVGVIDDVTRLSLPVTSKVTEKHNDTKECLFYAMGSDGTVSANKNAIKLIGDNTDLFVQGYIWNDSKKAGGATVSHLRFGPSQINQPYEIQSADFLAISEPTWPTKFPKAMLQRLRPNGVVLLNTHLTTPEALASALPSSFLSGLARKNAQLWVLDAVKVANENGLGKHINNCMQSAFFKLSQVLPFETALPLLLSSFEKAYGKRGSDLVKRNSDAAVAAVSALRQIPIPSEWATLPVEDSALSDSFFDTVSVKLARLEGESLPVSAFDPHGRYPTGMTKYEKRGIAASIPVVDMNKCTQCNLCSIICPHAAIRPFLLDPVESAGAPFESKRAVGGALTQGFDYRIQVTPLDCTGCAACSFTCADDALTMVPLTPAISAEEKHNWDFAISLPERAGRGNSKSSARESQLALPMLEFSGACAGCGETPYAKLVTQLFGERMLIANASGCSGVWGAAAGFSAYTTNAKGEGPAWGRSLYEDAAEYGLGLATASQSRRKILKDKVGVLIEETKVSAELAALLWRWVNGGLDDPGFSQQVSRLVPSLLASEAANNSSPALLEVIGLQKEFIKLSPWIFGGDGWAYDIGFGGLDHVLASGTNLNVLVLDTEGYANTGGQKSKATQLGAVQKFASDGYRRAKKSLAEMAMSYEDVYVATIAVGADPGQSVRALLEADSYNGPSLVLCYSPCIEHKIKTGLSRLSEEMRLAVHSGYWPLFRYHPVNGFTLDAPRKLSLPVSAFTDLEDRFGTLSRQQPEVAAALATQLQTFVSHHHSKLLARAGNASQSDAQVRILFAGATGNSAEIAGRLKGLLGSRGCTSTVDECEALTSSEPRVVLFCVSTVGDGEMPSAAALMVESLPTDLANLQYSIFGLGDSSYRSFCGAAKFLDAQLQERGARRFCEVGFGDDQDADKYETGFAKWAPTIIEALKLPHAISSAAAQSPFRVETARPAPQGLALNLAPPPGFFNLQVASSSAVGQTDPLALRVLSLSEVGKSGDLSYKVGDALSVLPRNDSVKVEKFLTSLGLDPSSTFIVSAAQKVSGGDLRKLTMLAGGAVRLTDIFEQVVDLFGKPTSHFIQQLQELTGADFAGDSSSFASALTSHSVLVKDLASLLFLLPPLKPRLYSIASSLRYSPQGAVDLLVVRADGGVCSNYLNTLEPGAIVKASVAASTFHIPPVSQPVVMAALGTGVAPFRAVLAERAAARSAGQSVGAALLFYGCRSQEDFAFSGEFNSWSASGLVDLRPAFSRVGVPKGYVQSQMKLMASEIHKLVGADGSFLLCGKAGAPALAVEAALHAALQEGGGLSKDEAVEFVTSLKESRRFSEEVY